MKFAIDKEKLQQRLKEQQERGARVSTDPKDSIIFKVSTEGKHLFRAVFYPHSKDPSSEPFVERFYHWGFPGGAVYCPKKNAGQDCHLCEFVWERVTSNKGNKEVVKKWAQLLPQMSVLIAGVARGREEEGCKFVRVSTREDKPSDKYNKVYGWFMDDDTTSWLDPDSGFDMELKFSKPEDGKSKFLKGAQFLMTDMSLARKSSVFGTKEEYEDFLKKVPDVDKEVFPKKTTKETLEILEKYREMLAKKSKKTSDTELNKSDGTSTAEPDPEVSSDGDSDATSEDELAAKLSKMGL